jgi:outer membrane lipoprotein-sorting protein
VQDMSIYFDDFGNKECVETMGSMDMGMAGKVQMHQMLITKDGYLYSFDMTNKTGTKTKINTGGSQKEIDFSNMTDEMMKQMKITKGGTEVLLGKSCQQYSMEDPTLKMKSTYSVWNGIPLKSEVEISGIVAKVTATKLEENATIPAEKFEIPKDVKITEVSDMNTKNK